MSRYVVITPARNEAAFIELTLKSMANQSDPPLKRVVVSDGSTDGTDELVSKYAAQHSWIELVRMPERKERHAALVEKVFRTTAHAYCQRFIEALSQVKASSVPRAAA